MIAHDINDYRMELNALIEYLTALYIRELILVGGAFIYPTYKITFYLLCNNMLGIPHNYSCINVCKYLLLTQLHCTGVTNV